jgi:peptidyl-prolyl cis-trans isomerase SurA
MDMKKFIIGLFVIASLVCNDVMAQKKGNPFMMVGDTPYYANDFYNAYFETLARGENIEVVAFARDYAGFCARVAEAKALGLDITATFKSGIDNYIQNYTTTYYSDAAAIERLSREAASRASEDVKIAHILIPVSPYAFEKDSLEARGRIDSVYAALKAGADWTTLANEINRNDTGGEIGFINIFQVPYEIETAAYTTAVGSYSAPVRSPYGYHIVKVLEKRPERGLVEISHIMIFRKDNEEDNAKALKDMRTALNMLKGGASFGNVAQRYSEDSSSIPNGGYLGFYGINSLRPEIEDIVFSLPEGGTTSIIETPEGWNIIRVISKVSNASYEERATFLTQKVQQDSRYLPAQRAYGKSIRDKYFYEVNEENLEKCCQTLSNMGYLYGEWNAGLIKDGGNQLFTIDTRTVYAEDFYASLMLSLDNYGEKAELRQVVREKLDDFSYSMALEIYVNSLPTTDAKVRTAIASYTDKARAYTALNKAVSDSLSTVSLDTLHAIYDRETTEFMWGERVKYDAVFTKYPDVAARIQQAFKDGHSLEEVLAVTNRGIASTASGREMTNEKDKAFKKDFEVKVGVSDIIQEEDTYFIFNIKEIIPPSRKTFDEAYNDIQRFYGDRCARELNNVLCTKYNVQIFTKELKAIEKGLPAQKKSHGFK